MAISVLNLIINGIPSILSTDPIIHLEYSKVLNLIINGTPSIQMSINATDDRWYCFKPYYKWNTFNT